MSTKPENLLLELYRNAQIPASDKSLKKVSLRDGKSNWLAIQQNPTKSSQWAWHARKGKEVVQIIKDNKWFGVFVEGQFIKY
jgi:predicted secreted protein